MGTPSLLIVSTHRGWVADFFREANLCPVYLDHGFDNPIPPDPDTTAWWTPTEHAARLRLAGASIPFQTPGPNLIEEFPLGFLKRNIWVGELKDIPDYPGGAFIKLAEAKTDKLPAQWWYSVDDFKARAERAQIPSNSMIHATGTLLRFAWEFRAFVHERTVLSVAPYAAPDGSVFPLPPPPAELQDKALQFAQNAAEALPFAPDGWVLDVGLTVHKEWVIVETNPAWSANPYDNDPAAALTVVAAATMPSDTAASEWFQWTPDPIIEHYAKSRILLKKSPLPR